MRLRKHLKVNDTAAAAIVVVGLIISFLENENHYSDEGKERNETSTYGNVMRSIVSVLTACLIILVIRHSSLLYDINREKLMGADMLNLSYFQSRYFIYMIIEVIINVIHWPPGVDHEQEFYQLDGKLILSWNSMALCWMILRCYLIFRLFKHYTKWADSDSESICEQHGCSANTKFALKAVLQEKPYLVLTASMASSIVIFGFATRIFERPYTHDNSDQDLNFDYVWNSMWLIVLTMTTVGYGDFYPRTHMGRFVVVLACFWGVFLVSMMVVTLTVSSEFTKGESRAYDILFRLNAKEQAKKRASYVLKSALQLFVLQRKFTEHPDYENLHIIKLNEMTNNLDAFRIQRNRAMKTDLPAEEMLRQLNEKIDIDLEEVRDQLTTAIELDSQLQKVELSQGSTLEALRSAVRHTRELKQYLLASKR